MDLGPLTLAEVSLLSEVRERRAPITIDDPRSSPLLPRGWATRFGLQSCRVVPLFREGRVMGACTLEYCGQPRRFRRDQRALAGLVAPVPETARLCQELAYTGNRLTALLKTTKRAAAIRESGQLLPWIAKEAAGLLQAEAAGLRIREGGPRGGSRGRPHLPRVDSLR